MGESTNQNKVEAWVEWWADNCTLIAQQLLDLGIENTRPEASSKLLQTYKGELFNSLNLTEAVIAKIIQDAANHKAVKNDVLHTEIKTLVQDSKKYLLNMEYDADGDIADLVYRWIALRAKFILPVPTVLTQNGERTADKPPTGAGTATGKGKGKRKRTKPEKLTRRQTKAYAQHLTGKSLSEIGNDLKISKQAAGKLVKRAKAVMETISRSVRAKQSLPTDKRGQPII